MTRNPGCQTPNLMFLVLGHSTVPPPLFLSSSYHCPIPYLTSRAQVTGRVGEVLKGFLMEATRQCFIGSGSPASAGLF